MLSLLYLSTSDIFALIEYASFVESSFILLSVSGLLWLRYKKPHLKRPIKVRSHIRAYVLCKDEHIGSESFFQTFQVHIAIPIVFLCLCAFLVFVPCYVRPLEVGMGVLITLTGIPFYFICIWWRPGPKFLRQLSIRGTELVQKLFISAKEDERMDWRVILKSDFYSIKYVLNNWTWVWISAFKVYI
jgi:hypothetical protein